ncbi:hypothetical protein BUZ62_12480, partial [Staphylococcus pasteuri]|uniref:hypothetical protein n=1 Tax=Staphylococcus pasteuri TaxID=45972 RepID=UPI000D47C691
VEFTYKHNDNNSLAFKFRILLVNFQSSLIENIKTKYTLKYNKSYKNIEITISDIEESLKFNNQSILTKNVDDIGEEYSLLHFNNYNFESLIKNDVDNIYMFLEINNVIYIIKLNSIVNKPVPVISSNIIKYIYEKKESM